MFVKFRDCTLTAASPVGFACISFGFRECGVTHGGHDVVSTAAGIGEESSQRLAESMRLAIEW